MKRFDDEFRQAFWLTVAVWTLSAVLFVLTVAVQGRSITSWMISSMAAMTVVGTLIGMNIYGLAARVRKSPPLVRYLSVGGVTLLASTGTALFDAWLASLAEAYNPEHHASVTLFVRFVINLVGFAWMNGLLAAIYVMLQSNRTVRERDRELAEARQAESEARVAVSEARAAAGAARLAALRYQLNPHFLFNTLNAVSSAVVTGRTERAETMLEKLSEFLRVTLQADPETLVPLEDELATLQAYLEIESVRFGERLAVEFVCPDELLAARVPSFLLQPLIENAVKYAVAPTSRTVTIRLEAELDGQDLVVSVEDDGDGTAVPSGTGLGLENVRQRLEVVYGPRGVLDYGRIDTGFRARVRLPLDLSFSSRPAEAA